MRDFCDFYYESKKIGNDSTSILWVNVHSFLPTPEVVYKHCDSFNNWWQKDFWELKFNPDFWYNEIIGKAKLQRLDSTSSIRFILFRSV